MSYNLDLCGESYDQLALRMFIEHRGIGMVPPFYAETANVKGDNDWPYWIVRNATCNSLGKIMSRET